MKTPGGNPRVTRPPILFVIDRLSPYGAERVCIDLAREMSRVRPVIVLTFGRETDDLGELNVDAGERLRHVRLAPPRGRLPAAAFAAWSIRRTAQRSGADEILSFMPMANVIATIGLVRVRCRVLVSEHNLITAFFRANRPKFLWRLLVTWAYGRAEYVVCVSDSVREDLVRSTNVLPAKCRVIYNPIDSARIGQLALDNSAAQSWRSSKSGPVIGVIAALKSAKAHEFAFAALTRLPPNVQLMLLGAGPQKAHLEALVTELGLIDRVHFLGQRQNPYPWMSVCDAIFVSSEYEGFGLVIAEAHVLGKPLVVRSAPGSSEIAAYLGLDPTVDTPDDAAAALLEALGSPIRSPDADAIPTLDPSVVADRYLALVTGG